ncbi:hypothetical protein S40293_11490 [Stachybotrys chartarum IBT 40293]|nr:hypothetical protein S40293_11490 [Stachybotrys chartarum IBT 40293]
MNASNRQDQDVDPRGLRRTAAAVGRVGRQTQPWTAELLPRLGEPCQYATIPFGPRFRNFTPAPAPACTGTVPALDDHDYPPSRAPHTRDDVSDPTPFRRTPGTAISTAMLVWSSLPPFLPARGSPRRV